MKYLKYLILVVAYFLVIVPGGALAQARVTGRITAEVVEVLTTSTGKQVGSYIVPVNNNAVLTHPSTNSDQRIKPATFSVSGLTDATFAVTLPDGPTTLTKSNGTGTLLVSDWTASSGHSHDNYILIGGTQKVTVGATLKISSLDESPKGTYTGSYQITFAYN